MKNEKVNNNSLKYGGGGTTHLVRSSMRTAFT